MSMPTRLVRPGVRQPGRAGLLVLAAVICCAIGPVRPAAAASSVDTFSGDYGYEFTDFTLTRGPLRLPFTRTYQSLQTRTRQPLGPLWFLSFDPTVGFLPPDGTDLLLTRGDGRWVRMDRQSDETFAPSAGGGVASFELVDPERTLADGRPSLASVATLTDGTVWRFDDLGNLAELDQPGGAALTIDRGNGVQILSIRGPDGAQLLTFGYSREGRLVRVSDVPNDPDRQAPPRSLRFDYDDKGRLIAVTDFAGFTTRYTYDGDSFRLTSIVDARGHTAITLTYDEQGRVATRTDARGLVDGGPSTLTYDAHPDGSRTTRDTRPPSGYAPTWQSSYEDRYDSGSFVERTYYPSPDSDPLTITIVRGATPSDPVTYTASGGATPDVDGEVAGPAVQGTLTGLLGESSVRVGAPSDPLPTPHCPSLSQPPRSTAPFDGTSNADLRLGLYAQAAFGSFDGGDRVYDPYGRLSAFSAPREVLGVLPAGQDTWRIEYDLDDRPTLVDAPPEAGGRERQISRFAYDEVGNLVQVTQPNGAVTRYQYDKRDALVEADWPSGATVRYEYDARGDLARARLRPSDGSAEQVVDYAFDGLHRPRTMIRYYAWPDLAGADVLMYTYDGDGMCAAYHVDPRLLSETRPMPSLTGHQQPGGPADEADLRGGPLGIESLQGPGLAAALALAALMVVGASTLIWLLKSQIGLDSREP